MVGDRAREKIRIDDSRRGASPRGLRAHNERLVLALLHSGGTLSAAELVRLSGLSAQGISVLLRHLEQSGRIVRGEPMRGKVGQPSIPISLNPDGAFILGAKIGRRSADLVLVGLDGKVRAHRWLAYRWPDPPHVLEWVQSTSQELAATVHLVSGLGIALPSRLWDWAGELSETHSAMELWRDLDPVQAMLGLPFPTLVINDGSAACAAEMTFGSLSQRDDVLYLFIGTYIGGGLTQSGRLLLGPTGNAASLGSVLVQTSDGTTRQLIDVASLVVLERMLNDRTGLERGSLTRPDPWDTADPLIEDWISQAASGIAQAIVSVVAVTDSRLAVIDGALPFPVLDTLIDRIRTVMKSLPVAGIDPPRLERGTVGPLARAIGAAAFVMNERFFAWPADLQHLLDSRPRGSAVSPALI